MRKRNPFIQIKPAWLQRLGQLAACAAACWLLSIPTLAGQASLPPSGPALPPGQDEATGSWILVGSDQDHTWQGDNFHGLKSEYTPILSGSTLGATYTQYNIQFNPKQPVTIASQLTGTCEWYWPNENIPGEIVAKTEYPFTMSVDANASGSNFLGATVNGYTGDADQDGKFAFAQVYLDISGQVLSGHNEDSRVLVLAPAKSDQETRTIILTCQVDIVTVKTSYYYRWQKGGCAATLKAPQDMEPGKEFTPQVSVVDSDKKPVTPKSDAWYLNDQPSGIPMKWDGKQAVVEYEYTCPNENQSKRAKLTIPAAGSCRATIILPDKMEADKEFMPRAEVVDLEDKLVKPQDERWFYNGAASALPMKWDGKAATVSYEYTCPLDKKPGKAKITIPASDKAAGWLVVVGGAGAVAAAGLAAVLAGGALALGNRPKGKKGPPPPKYILQVDKTYLEVRPKENAPLFIQAWKLSSDGSVTPAANASIQVVIPQPAAGLAVAPATGTGALRCAFSVPKPSVCAALQVNIIAAVGESKTQAQVTVKIVPLYELELDWHDPQRKKPEVGKAEIFARARLTATPMPDEKTTPDMLAEKIKLAVEGPNNDALELRSAPPSLQGPYARNGALWIPILAKHMAQQEGNPALVARFSESNQKLEKRLTIELSQALSFGMWANGKKQAEVTYGPMGDEQGWYFGDITVYFHEPKNDNRVMVPEFGTDIASPTFLTQPGDILEIRNYGEERPGWYTGEVYLKNGVDLEQYFGPDLTQANAQVHLTVRVTADTKQVYTSSVTYQLCPAVELVALPCDPDSGEPALEREYKGITLGKYSFLADGEDRLGVQLYYRRTDWPEDAERVVPFGQIIKAELGGNNLAEYVLGAPDMPFEPVTDHAGMWSTTAGAKVPLLASARRQSGELKLHVEARLAGQPPYYRVKSREVDLSTRSDTLDQALKPIFLHLNLWVIPGWRRGTSVAGAVVAVKTPGAEPVVLTSEFELELGVQTGGPGLSAQVVYALRGASRRGLTSDSKIPDWLQAWRLTYSGLQWNEVKKANFSVLCRFKDAPEATRFYINVEENGSEMFAALIADADTIDLNNPEWDQWENAWSFQLLNKIILPEFRGPIYNLRRSLYMIFYGSGNMPPQYEHYSCGDYSLRIRTYLIKRRNENPATALKMNGLECASFTISGAHDFAGIYLSGMDPDDGPIFIDPWYEQHWTEKATDANFGYKFQAVKFTAACSGAVAELFLIARFIQHCFRVVRGAAGLPSVLEIVKALRTLASGLTLKVAALLSDIAAGGTSWSIMGPNRDVPEQDSDLNYIIHRELDLFEYYHEEWMKQPSPPPVKTVNWPGAR